MVQDATLLQYVWYMGVWPISLFGLGLLWLLPPALRAGRGAVPVWRRLAIAALLAALAAVPALPTTVRPVAILRGIARVTYTDRQGREQEFVPRLDGQPEVLVILIVWLLTVKLARQMLRLPTKFGALDQLPPVSDAALRARIAELAAGMGLRAPRVVQPATTSGEANAFAAGLLVPFVVVFDGVEQRLTVAERDAVVAHELAHLARRHLPERFLVTVLVGVAAVIASGHVPWYVASLWFLAALTFAHRLLGHRHEIQADAAGARSTGSAAMAAALGKIHAVGQIADAGPWFHALLSHPSLAVRAAHLAAAAPAGERERIAVDAALVARCRRARRVALTLWGGLLAAVIWLGSMPAAAPLAAGLTVLLLAVPLLPLIAFVPEIRDSLQLGRGLRWRTWVIAAMSVAVWYVLLVIASQLPADSRGYGVVAVLLIGVAWLMFGGRRALARRRALQAKLHQRDLRGYLALCERLPRSLRRVPAVRLKEVLVRAALGDRTAAVAALRQLAADRPRFRVARLWLARILRTSEPAAAVTIARELAAEVPGNQLAQGVLASCLLYAGELAEAASVIARVIAARPRQGVWQAVRARIAVAAGDFTEAAVALAAAEERVPGDASVALARAELALATGAADAAVAVRKFRELAAALPLLLLGEDLARLEARLAAAAPPPP
jgi:Zn-dependent protease with chaperone function/tetratricopeptide (TPR) repeat protein